VKSAYFHPRQVFPNYGNQKIPSNPKTSCNWWMYEDEVRLRFKDKRKKRKRERERERERKKERRIPDIEFRDGARLFDN
jgi:hypothetical protein